MKRFLACALLCVLVFCTAGQAGATVYNFEGTWDSLSGSGLFFEELNPTSHFSGWVDYTWPGDDQETAGGDASPQYHIPGFAYYLQISDSVSCSNTETAIYMYYPEDDEHTFVIYDEVPLLVPRNDLFLDGVYLFLSSSDILHRPLPLDLSSVTGGSVSLGFPSYGSAPWGDMSGTITSFSAAPVPEPSTILLVGLGLCALVGARKFIVGRPGR